MSGIAATLTHLAACVPAVGVEPSGRLAYAVTFPLRWGWPAALFWAGVLAALVWHLAARRRRARRDEVTVTVLDVRPVTPDPNTDQEPRP